MTLVDTNVFLDLFSTDPVWHEWSGMELDRAAIQGRILINDMIYAELSVRSATIEILDAVLDRMNVVRVAMPKQALFLAGKTYQRYRSIGGTRANVLPDFFIGAHAAVSDLALLTRDARRYRHYFPTIDLITP